MEVDRMSRDLVKSLQRREICLFHGKLVLLKPLIDREWVKEGLKKIECVN